MNRSLWRLALPVTLLLAFLVYAIGLNGPLLFDDKDNLIPVAAWLEGRTNWQSVVFGNNSGLLGRPLSMLSFILNAALLGPDVWGFKLGNVLIHLFNGCLVFALTRVLTRCGALTRSTGRDVLWLPWLSTSLWLLHPLLVSTVLYVVQRMAMLAALFTLLALIAYVYGRIALAAGQQRRGVLLIGFLLPICTLLAALSKENGILAPALCAVIELFVFQPTPGARRAVPSRAFIGTALVLPMLIALALTAMQFPLISAGYVNRPFTLIERLLTQPRVLWSYVGALLLPDGPHLGVYHDDYPISHGLLDPSTTTLAIVAWLTSLTAAWHWRREIPGLALGLSLFLVGHALESSVFPLIMYFEHRNYLPALGVIWAALSVTVYAINALGARIRNPPRIFGASAVALILVLAIATAARASVWVSRHAIMQQALAHHPDSRWLRQDLIAEAMGQQPPDFDAVRLHADHMRRSSDPSTRRLAAVERLLADCNSKAEVDPGTVQAVFNGRPEPLEPDLVAIFELLARRLSLEPCIGLSSENAAEQLSNMLDRSELTIDNPALRNLRFVAAKLYASVNQVSKALAQAGPAQANGPTDLRIPIFVAEFLVHQGDRAAASRVLDSVEAKLVNGEIAERRTIAAVRKRVLDETQ